MAKIVPTARREDTLPLTNQPNVKKKEMRPPYRHYTVWYGTDLNNVAFTATPDGVHHGSLEFEILLYDPDGELMNAVREMVKAKLPAMGYESCCRAAWNSIRILTRRPRVSTSCV
jgi:hypothetical protein